MVIDVAHLFRTFVNGAWRALGVVGWRAANACRLIASAGLIGRDVSADEAMRLLKISQGVAIA